VAKADDVNAALTLREYLKLKGRFVAKNQRGQVVIQKWPRKRGRRATTLQRAWRDKFQDVARVTKTPTAQDLDISTTIAKNSGWYYRDVLTAAAYGTLWRTKGEVIIKTPTVRVTQTGFTAIPTAAPTTLVPTSLIWDNNSFWDSITNPSRLTVKAGGLYLLSFIDERNNLSQQQNIQYYIRKNGTTDEQTFAIYGWCNFGFKYGFTTLVYCSAGDYLEMRARGTVNNQQVRIDSLSLLAITPESLIP